jgi:hypothetical protein
MINSENNNFQISQENTFLDIGMITDVKSVDINNDGWIDILVIGQWMGIKVFINNNGVFEEQTKKYNLAKSVGLWNSMEIKDIDGDGDQDIVAGNLGLNTYFKKGDKIYINDFDNNGTIEQIICHKIGEKFFPIVDRDELISQLPYLKKKFVRFNNYASASIENIFNTNQLDKSIKYQIDLLESSWFENKNGKFYVHNLPPQAQYSSVYSIKVDDFNNDKILDIVLGGNQYKVKPQFGRNDASNGLIIYGEKKDGNYKLERQINLEIDGQIRNFEVLNNKEFKVLIVAVNDDDVKFKKIN